MTISEPFSPRRAPAVEWILAVAVVAALALVVWRFLQTGYLPQPFYYRVSESLMDWFSTAYWANNGQAFSTWHTLYPPLSFVFLKALTVKGCYVAGEVAGRQCDGLSRAVILAIFLGNFALVWATYRVNDARTAIPRTIAMCLGLPMLYALERGNLLLPCFTCFALGYGDLIRARWARWLALGLAMNFKPYLGLVSLPLLLRRKWSWVIGAAVFALAIYGVTLLLYGSGGPLEIIRNESQYAVAASKNAFADIYYGTSYWPLIRLLRAPEPGLVLASPPVAAVWAAVLTAALRAPQIMTLALLTFALFRPGATQVRRLGALIACSAVTAYVTGSAGYAQIFMVFLVLFEPWRGVTRKIILTATYLICIPADLVLQPFIHAPGVDFLSGRTVMADFGVSLGHFVRPALLLVIQGGLLVLNIADLRRPSGQDSRHDDGLTCAPTLGGLSADGANA